jgi:hypothetical protein
MDASTIEYSLSVPEFKSKNNINTVDIFDNPATGKTFWSAGEHSGPVSGKTDMAKELQFAIFSDGTACLCNRNGLVPTMSI